jgi:hypothetical protein
LRQEIEEGNNEEIGHRDDEKVGWQNRYQSGPQKCGQSCSKACESASKESS